MRLKVYHVRLRTLLVACACSSIDLRESASNLHPEETVETDFLTELPLFR